MSDNERFALNKRAVHDALKKLCRDPSGDAANIYADDFEMFGFHPINEFSGGANVIDKLWSPLKHALPDIERREFVLIAGEFEGRDIVSSVGCFQGTFENDLFDIPATHGVVHIRFGEVHHIAAGKIVTTYMIVDLLDLMNQAGCWPIARSAGAEHLWPGPASNDGVRPDVVDPQGGATNLALVKKMHGGLLKFDGKNIESMDHQKYWTEDFLWYGPSGIGTTRGLNGFRAHHQVPFLRAFPDRKVGVHFGEVGDGDFVVTGGWPSVIGTHTGPDWLALPPTGKRVEMRVMDFYRVDGDLIAENWVPIDIIDILRQLGVDVFQRMRHLRGNPRMQL